MGRGSNTNQDDFSRSEQFTWKQIRTSDNLIVIDNNVYDVKNFRTIHPGGEELIRDHICQDATVFFNF
jgi:cytochrome b involved in lipid metabolism